MSKNSFERLILLKLKNINDKRSCMIIYQYLILCLPFAYKTSRRHFNLIHITFFVHSHHQFKMAERLFISIQTFTISALCIDYRFVRHPLCCFLIKFVTKSTFLNISSFIGISTMTWTFYYFLKDRKKDILCYV